MVREASLCGSLFFCSASALVVFEEVVGIQEATEFERRKDDTLGFDEFEVGLAGEDWKCWKRLGKSGLHEGSVRVRQVYEYGGGGLEATGGDGEKAGRTVRNGTVPDRECRDCDIAGVGRRWAENLRCGWGF